MGVEGGLLLLVLASVAACLAIEALKLREWARIVSIASVAAGIGFALFSILAFWIYRLIPIVAMIVFHLLVMATGAWMLTYLVRPRVKQAFRGMTA
jgi:CHASE2 domain-containing sensor protein